MVHCSETNKEYILEVNDSSIGDDVIKLSDLTDECQNLTRDRSGVEPRDRGHERGKRTHFKEDDRGSRGRWMSKHMILSTIPKMIIHHRTNHINSRRDTSWRSIFILYTGAAIPTETAEGQNVYKALEVELINVENLKLEAEQTLKKATKKVISSSSHLDHDERSLYFFLTRTDSLSLWHKLWIEETERELFQERTWCRYGTRNWIVYSSASVISRLQTKKMKEKAKKKKKKAEKI